jgi:hypothetical protein
MGTNVRQNTEENKISKKMKQRDKAEWPEERKGKKRAKTNSEGREK